MFKNNFYQESLGSSSISVSTWPCRGQEPGSIPGTGVVSKRTIYISYKILYLMVLAKKVILEPVPKGAGPSRYSKQFLELLYNTTIKEGDIFPKSEELAELFIENLLKFKVLKTIPKGKVTINAKTLIEIKK